MKQPFIVAELSANHLGQRKRALDLVAAAADAGADAIKIQCWSPDHMVLDRAATVDAGAWVGRNLHDLYQQCHAPLEWAFSIFQSATDHGMIGFASVFDIPALEHLERIGCPRYKIASCEIVDTPLITKVAKTGKPMIISTGMATDLEIQAAIIAALDGGASELTLLKCTSAYPATAQDCNLRTIPDMRGRFLQDVGLSDHTRGIIAAVTATALGATVIEKHLTLNRIDGGPDAGFSAEPDEFAAMVTACREAAETLGGIHYGPLPNEQPTLALRRSLYYTRAVAAGNTITQADIASARPAAGLPPANLKAVIGRRLKDSTQAGQPVQWEDFNA